MAAQKGLVRQRQVDKAPGVGVLFVLIAQCAVKAPTLERQPIGQGGGLHKGLFYLDLVVVVQAQGQRAVAQVVHIGAEGDLRLTEAEAALARTHAVTITAQVEPAQLPVFGVFRQVGVGARQDHADGGVEGAVALAGGARCGGLRGDGERGGCGLGGGCRGGGHRARCGGGLLRLVQAGFQRLQALFVLLAQLLHLAAQLLQFGLAGGGVSGQGGKQGGGDRAHHGGVLQHGVGCLTNQNAARRHMLRPRVRTGGGMASANATPSGRGRRYISNRQRRGRA